MVKCNVKDRIILVSLTLWFVLALAISGGCKKKDQPEDNQQAIGYQKTEHISASEKIDKVDTSEKTGLRILYAGLPNTDRAKDFVEFLTKHFEQVETTDYNTFTEDQTADFDVTILDYDGVEFRAPRPNISRQYARATVTMGVPGAFICSSLSLKTGYL